MHNIDIQHLVFWQPTLSIHQSALLRSLAASSGARVTLVVDEELVARRRELGWHRPDFGTASVIVRPTGREQSDLLARDASSSVHIFSGTRGSGPLVWHAFRAGLGSSARIGIYSEAHKGMGFKGLVRRVRGRYDAWQFGKRVDFILAVGNKGVEWFRKSGYPPAGIVPFAYFCETPVRPDDLPEGETEAGGMFDLVFAGQLIPRKGWDILLHALDGLAGLNWRLHVVGDGADRGKVAALASRLGLIDSVQFYGRLPNCETTSIIWKSDLLVLPSRWDGWGAVVNEALMCGVPVVCSDQCGAADLLDGCERGEVFSSGSVAALTAVLARRIAQGKKDPGRSARIRDWSSCIGGESAAAYLMAAVRASIAGDSRPAPPWLRQTGGCA